ncbi:MAG: LolA family protein [Candidatus Hydrogenedens sp.]
MLKHFNKTHCLTLILLCSFSMLTFAEASLDEVSTKLISAWEKQKTVKADVGADANFPINNTNTMKLKGIGELFIKRDGDNEKFAQKLSAFPASAVESGNSALLNTPIAKATVIFDGKEFFVTYQLLAVTDTIKTSPDITKGAIPIGGKKMFDAVKEKMNITVEPETEWDGKKMIKLKLEPKEGPGGDFSSANVLMDPDLGIIRRLEIIGKDSTPMFLIEYKNVKTGVDIPNEIFQIPATPPTPPANGK